jgi:hypothetical protein
MHNKKSLPLQQELLHLVGRNSHCDILGSWNLFHYLIFLMCQELKITSAVELN